MSKAFWERSVAEQEHREVDCLRNDVKKGRHASVEAEEEAARITAEVQSHQRLLHEIDVIMHRD